MKVKSRWIDSEEGRSAFVKIVKRLRKGRRLRERHTPFGLTKDGYADFRGLDLSNQKFSGIRITNADFSYSNFDRSWLKRSKFTDVLFEKTSFVETRDVGNVFENVSFIKCKFNYAGLGYDGARYKSCIFEGSSFARTLFSNAVFLACVFRNSKLNGSDFYGSSFDDCKFIGKLEDVWFRGRYSDSYLFKGPFGYARKNRMKNVSFEGAILEDVSFTNNCDLSSIILPKTGNYQLFDKGKNRLEYLIHRINDWEEPQKTEVNHFMSFLLLHSKNQDYFLLNIDLVKKDLGDETANGMISILNEYESHKPQGLIAFLKSLIGVH